MEVRRRLGGVAAVDITVPLNALSMHLPSGLVTHSRF